MTVSNQTNRTSAIGSGAIGQEVPFSFPIKATSDLTVKKRITATGVETNLDETTNYTVEINGDNGGTLTTVTVIEATEQIHIIRNTPKTQSLDLEQGGSFNAENVEDALDKNTKLIIENKDAIGKAITFPPTDAAGLTTELPSSIDRASKNLTCDSSGNITASVSVEEGSVSFTTFGTNMAEAANALTAKTVMNLAYVFDVMDYGAVGDGVTDDTAAFVACNAAIATAGFGTMYIPPGTFLITDEILISTHGTWIEGASQKVANIMFNPVAQKTLFKFAKPDTTIVNCGIRNLSILTTATTIQKIAIETEDSDHFDLKHISIIWGASTGFNCVGLKTNGASTLTGSDLIFNVDTPFQFTPMTYAILSTDLDQVHIYNLTSIAWSTKPHVEVADGVQISNVTFDGYQAWGTGGYGFYWNDATTPGASINLVLKNIRWEQSTNANGYIVYIDPGSALYNCILENIYGGTGNNHKGFYFREMVSLSLKHCHYAGTAEALNMDETCRPVSLENVFFQVGSTVSVGNLVKVYDSSRMDNIAGSISPFVLYNQVQYPTRYPTFGVPINVAGINIVTNNGFVVTNDEKVLTNI